VPNVAQGVRMPRTLQRDVAAIAEASGESFNAAVCRLLEAGVRLQQQGAPLHLLGADLPAMAAEAAAEAVQAVVASAVEDAVRRVAADFGHLHDASTALLQQAQWRTVALAEAVAAGAPPEVLQEHATTAAGLVAAVRQVEGQRAPPGHTAPQQVTWQELAERAGSRPTAAERDAEFARRKGLWEVEDAARRMAAVDDAAFGNVHDDSAADAPPERRAEADRRAQHPDDDVPTPPGVPDRYMAEGKAQDGRRKGQRRKAEGQAVVALTVEDAARRMAAVDDAAFGNVHDAEGQAVVADAPGTLAARLEALRQELRKTPGLNRKDNINLERHATRCTRLLAELRKTHDRYDPDLLSKAERLLVEGAELIADNRVRWGRSLVRSRRKAEAHRRTQAEADARKAGTP
jgi:hypothetical protein